MLNLNKSDTTFTCRNLLRFIIFPTIFVGICVVVLNYYYCEISLYEIPGMRSKSPRFWSITNGLQMDEVKNTSVTSNLLKAQFPDADEFYISRKIPLVVAVEHGIVSVVRMGGIQNGFENIHQNTYVLSESMMIFIAHCLEKEGVYLPYELIVSQNKEYAYSAFVTPYLDNPYVRNNGNVVALDFTNSQCNYPNIILFYKNNECVGFDLFNPDCLSLKRKRSVGPVKKLPD